MPQLGTPELNENLTEGTPDQEISEIRKDGFHRGAPIQLVRVARPATQRLNEMIREVFLSRSSGSSSSKAMARKLPWNSSSLKCGL